MDKLTQDIKKVLITEISKAIDNSSVEVSNDIERPPKVDMGNFSYPCFGLAKSLGKSPNEIANDLASKIQSSEIIEKVIALGPYLNFYLKPSFWNLEVMNAVKGEPLVQKQGETVMIEYSGPNPCKAFHMGHVRNTSLGVSMINLYRYSGYNVVPVNYLNDTGTHIAKVMWLYLRSYTGKEPQENKGEWLGELYVKANQMLDDDDSLLEEVHAIHKEIESGNSDKRELLETFKAWSQQAFDIIYDQLDATFDTYFYDSDYIIAGKKMVEELVEKKIAKKSEGAIVVDLEDDGLHTAMVLKTDGTALYLTKDLAMAKDRFDRYNVDKLLYVVGSEQILNFKQLFRILDLYGFEHAKDCVHLSYELVNAPDGKKMSTRDGTVVLYHEFYEQSVSKILAETIKRHSDWEKSKQFIVAERIALAAIKFEMLKTDSNKTINFDIEKALDLKGDTGPYLLYTVARIQSLIKKFPEVDVQIDYSILISDEEKAIINHLAKLYYTFDYAANNNNPAVIAHYCLELAHSFNHFYHIHSIQNSESEALKNARIVLMNSVFTAFSKSLTMLGIKYVDEM